MVEHRKKYIRRQADDFRELCKTGRYGIIDLFKDCERLDYKLIRYPLGDDADLGFALKRDSDTIIFVNSSCRLSRAIFTLAHEIGHVRLHLDETPSFIDTHSTIRSEDDKEQEANYFAACLLMPEEKVKLFVENEVFQDEGQSITALDIARIMSEFSVSYDMTLNRLEYLRIIDSNQKLILDTAKNEKRVGNLLRSIGGNARLNEVGSEIDIPHEYLDYAIDVYNRRAIPKETLEKTLNYYQLEWDDISDKLAIIAEFTYL